MRRRDTTKRTDQSTDRKVKICLLGDTAVGKTSLIHRLVKNKFNENYHPTISTTVNQKNIIIKKPERKKKLNLDLTIWDITGQINFRKLLHPHYLKGAKGAILVCDLTKRESLDNLGEWLESLSSECQMVPFVIIANKSDLTDDHKFGRREIEDIASAYASPFFITSAKTGDNIENALRTLTGKIMEEGSGK